jgi:hypothetical protein
MRFEDKSKQVLEKMNILNDDKIQDEVFQFNVSIFEVIEKAEEIKQSRKQVIENIIFIFTALIILTCFIMLTLNLGGKFLLYFQIIATTILPIILIPMAKYSVNKGER